MTTYKPRSVLITGATSDFGVAFAKRFAAIGCNLVLHGRNEEKLKDMVASLPEVQKHLLIADLSDLSGLEQKIAAIPSAFRPVDLLINNAGGALGLDKFHELSLQDADAMIDANCRGLVHFSRLVMPDMAKAKRGHVINITSVAGSWPYPGGNIYAASKAFAKHLSLSMRCDLQGTNIRVTSIEPGMVETGFSLKRFKGDQAKADAVYANTAPLTADDIAETVFWTATLPEHVNINSLEVMPTVQSWAGWAIERSA